MGRATGAFALVHQDGERILTYDTGVGTLTFTLRDLAGTVLREYRFDDLAKVWSWQKDYVYRDGLHLAAIDSAGTKHFHLDHLGTIRRTTDSAGSVAVRHDYYPFGQEASSATGDSERMKFTGHERDLRDPTRTTDDLDYMHARYYNPTIARFVSVDPVRGRHETPQSFNLYAYVQGRAASAVDPHGLALRLAKVSSPEDVATLLEEIQGKTGLQLKVVNGRLVVAKDLLKTGDMTRQQVSGVARALMLEALNSSTTFSLSVVRGDKIVAYGKATGDAVTIDATDFSMAKYTGVPRATFDMSMVFFHELAHTSLRGLNDPPEFLEFLPGEVERLVVNPIRHKLGLPARLEYRAMGRKDGFAELKFANGYVLVPDL